MPETVCYTDGFVKQGVNSAGIHGIRPRIPLEEYVSVFRTEIFATVACAEENLKIYSEFG